MRRVRLVGCWSAFDACRLRGSGEARTVPKRVLALALGAIWSDGDAAALVLGWDRGVSAARVVTWQQTNMCDGVQTCLARDEHAGMCFSINIESI